MKRARPLARLNPVTRLALLASRFINYKTLMGGRRSLLPFDCVVRETMERIMKPEIKERWLAALESGEYKKGKNYMRAHIGQEYTYCCLGVLTDLYCKETGDEFYTLFPRNEDGSNRLQTSILPRPVRQWADLHSIDLMRELAADNDTRTDGQFPIHMIKGI